MSANVLVAQSGGPSPVMNNSLRGVIEACRDYPSIFDRIYGAWHGIEGVLKEELIDISAQPQREIDLLETTPAAGAIGTCRYKLRDGQVKDLERIVEVLAAHRIGFFFYIGGNDSMDTAAKVSALASAHGVPLVATGIPKTIDNDVGDAEFRLIDHTPGYGSVARYWACCIQNANEENAGSCSCDPVLVIQVMGRKIGFIPAAVRLGDPGRSMPLRIFMPESGLTLEELTDKVNETVRACGRCIVALSEGFDVGPVGERRDAFNHVLFGSSDMTAERVVVAWLNKKGLAARGSARGHAAGTDQRDAMVYASAVDLREAFEVGRHAVRIAARDGSGWMATILRRDGARYAVSYDKVRLDVIANSERRFPAHWLSADRTDVTDEFVRYASPLLGEEWVHVPLENGIQRFARFERVFAERRCPVYTPEAHLAEKQS